jgi:hypothetical protein
VYEPQVTQSESQRNSEARMLADHDGLTRRDFDWSDVPDAPHCKECGHDFDAPAYDGDEQVCPWCGSARIVRA